MSFYRNLEVPYFSQRENKTVWHERYTSNDDVVKKNPSLIGTIIPNGKTDSKAKNSCNITCLAMILHYFGVTSDTPDEMMRKVFEPSVSELATYSDGQKKLAAEAYTNGGFFESVYNMKSFAEKFYNVTVDASETKKMDDIKKEVLSGYPVLVSCGITRAYASSEYVSPSKEEAYSNVFNKKLSATNASDYNNKLTEYRNQMNEKEQQLSNTSLTGKEKEAITGQLDTLKANKKMLEDEYIKILNKYLNDHRFHGHYVVIRGITDNGVIINDPWGKPVINTEGKGEYYTIMNGDNIHLTQKDFDKQYFQDKHFYSCLIIREKRWNFVSHKPDFLVTNEKFLENCRKAEMFEFGGYPIKRSNLWHNGLHFGSTIGNEIYPIGPGQLVAARIVNKDSEGKEPANGSCCFVLVKHQIKDNKDCLKDFFACYMHLNPIDNLDEITGNGEKTNIKWLDDLIKRTKGVRQIRYGKDNTSFYAESDTEGKKEIGKLPDSSIFLLDSINEKEKKIYFYYDFDNEVKKYWVGYSDNVLTRSDNSRIFTKLLDDLKSGKVVYFNDKDLLTVDSMIEVTNTSPIGFMGKYGGYSDNLKESLHFEIFSNDVLIEDTAGFTIIKESDLPANIKNYSAMCNRENMIAFFEDKNLYGVFDFQFLNDDGIITKKEMINFYNSKDGAEKFQNYIIQHISEWSDKINWSQALEKARGVSNKGFAAIIRNENFEDTINNYINSIYNPFKWFNAECIAAMNTNSSLFDKGYATYYHPVRFIQWLDDNKK